MKTIEGNYIQWPVLIFFKFWRWWWDEDDGYFFLF